MMQKDMKTGIHLSGGYISIAHSVCAYSAFAVALVVGVWLHFEKIVQNAHYGYPDEWFPSVSATIGDRYPERSLFQILIALTAGPRFLLIVLNYLRLSSNGPKTSKVAIFSGIARTFTCGGWVYITSTDDHDWHDIFMISYIVLTIPWTFCITMISEPNSFVKKLRAITASVFFLTLVPLIYWFIQHRVHRIAGAYTIYAFFEWALIVLDIGFDSWSAYDLKDIQISITGGSLTFLQESKEVTQSEPKKTKKEEGDVESDLQRFIIDFINAISFWSIVTSLILCIWYFPLWLLGISGYEVVIIVFVVAPMLGALPVLKTQFAKYPSISRTLAVLFGIGAYKIDEPEGRLICCTAGTAFAVISFVNEFSNLGSKQAELNSYCIANMLGLLATSVMKFAFYSNNPIWPIMHKENGGQNALGLTVGLLSAIYTRSFKNQASVGSKDMNTSVSRFKGSTILAAMGLGGYFYILHSFLCDSHTLVSWSWSGFPVTGPTAITGALPHFVSFSFGIIASVYFNQRYLTSLLHVLIGGISCYVLYKYADWTGFLGACIFTFYSTSIAPIILCSANGKHTTITFAVAMTFYLILSLGSTWTVAYAFVPMGWILRERSDIILISSFFMTTIGILNYKLKMMKPNFKLPISKGTMGYILNTLTILLACASVTTFSRYQFSEIVPYNSESETFTAGIWCVHFGLDNDMWSSEVRMRDLIRDAQVDIIGLLESDTQRLVGGNRDFTQRIAEDLGMYVDYGPGPNKHTWGAALLSKFPIIRSEHHLMPSPVGELAPAIHATLDIYGELVDIIVFHSGQEEDEEDRRLQSLGIAQIANSSTRPLVLLSYLVTDPLEGNYNTYVSEESGLRDIDSTDWDRWCEYILFRDLRKVAYARISRSTITDTELQIAKFRLLNEEEKEQASEKDLYGNTLVSEEDIDPTLRMPSIFKGKGVRGHYYHVFDEPRYYRQEIN